MIVLAPMTPAAAQTIALWRYQPPYDFYDGSGPAETAECIHPQCGAGASVEPAVIGRVNASLPTTRTTPPVCTTLPRNHEAAIVDFPTPQVPVMMSVGTDPPALHGRYP